MHRKLVALLTVGLVTGCATSSVSEGPTPISNGPAAAPVLQLLDITPGDGARVDSGTVLVASLAYYIPDFDPDRMYLVSPVFVGTEGGTFNRGGGQAQIRSPMGIVTVQHSLAHLWAGVLNQPTTPLTGIFFLLEHDLVSTVEDTVQVGAQIRVRTATGRSAVRARSRTFYFNGSGPIRSLGAGFPSLLEEYRTYRPHKALAIAYETPARWTHGYSYGYESSDGAGKRALEECRASAERRGIDAPCRLLMVDDQQAEPQVGHPPVHPSDLVRRTLRR